MPEQSSEQYGDIGAGSQPQPTPDAPSWHIRLFGTLEVEHGGRLIARFRAQRYGVLLAYLALHPRQVHARDDLIELLWPDVDRDTGRTRLRQALASLRRQLEPPGTPPGSVLITRGHVGVHLNPAVVRTDVADFEAHLRQAAPGTADLPADKQAQAHHLQAVLDVYTGPLLPGFWLEWILQERERLGAAYVDTLRRLGAYREATGDLVGALDLARRASVADPNHLPAHSDVMRLLAASGRDDDALRRFDTITRLCEGHLGEEIPPENRILAHDLRRRRQRSHPPVHRAEVPPSEAGLGGNLHAAEGNEGRLPPRLPVPLTPFFGREVETARILDLLQDRPCGGARLVTLTGLGGAGKTRLALHVARRWNDINGCGEERSSSPVCAFVPLVDVSDPNALPQTIADALGLDRVPNRTPAEQIVEALSRRPPSLLVLDNFETLLSGEDVEGEPAGAAFCVVTLLQSLPSLACLVTSRQQLLVDGEREFSVLPLPIPPPAEDPDPAGLLAVPSVALFVDRAQQARPDFQITARNAKVVAELCARLEGIPLAIEIAATGSNMLSVSALLARLDEIGRFSLLTSRRRDIAPRHRTLGAAIETSVRTLPPDLQAFFARLCVFRGGWTAEAAAAVCGVAPLARAEDALAHLRERSLISLAAPSTSHSDTSDVPLRFTLLETLREFGAEHLEEMLGSSEAAVLRERHARYFLALAEEAEPHLFGPDPVPWLDRLEAEQANLNAALAWARDEESPPSLLGLRLAGALCRFWGLRASLADARRWLETFLERGNSDGDEDEIGGLAARAKVLLGAADFPFTQADNARLRDWASESLRLYRKIGDKQGTTRALRRLGTLLAQDHRSAEARPLAEESQALCRETGDEAGEADGLCLLAQIASHAGDERAIPLMEQALAQWRRLGYVERVADTLNHLGCWTLWSGDVERAEGLLEEALALCRHLDDHIGIARALWALGNVALTRGDLAGAAARLEESIAGDRARGASGINARNDLARVRLDQQDGEGAKALLLENLSLTPDEVWTVRYVFRYLAQIAATNRPGKVGRPALAARLWGAAWAQHEVLVRRLIERGAEPSSHSTDLLERPFIAAVRGALGERAFRAAVDAGKSLPLEQAIALAHDA